MKKLIAAWRGCSSRLAGIACAWACMLFLSCAFGDGDAVQSLFEENDDPLYVAAGYDSSSNYAIYSSPTGTEWSGSLVPVLEAGTLNFVLYGNGMFLAAGSPPNYYLSTDGFLWGEGNTGGGPVIYNQYDGVYGGGRFVVVGSDSTFFASVFTSEDALVWINGSLNGKISGELYGVAYGNGRFVAVGGSGIIVASTDGLVWTDQLGPLTALTLYDVAYGNGRFVAVGTGGTATVSPDGFAWSKNFTVSTDYPELYGIAYGGGRFVAVGGSAGMGAVYLSEDGIAWSKNVFGDAGLDFQDVAYCRGYFIAVTNSGDAAYSPQGVSWNTRRVGDSAGLYGVACRP